ncbi:MAG: hypothetical protein HC920_08050 [Oscillatoriales cyanobacterium SM2_3_0]|nr:hypothetical protein [Oscillatoriales cyanobacterium SM2_3_0]
MSQPPSPKPQSPVTPSPPATNLKLVAEVWSDGAGNLWLCSHLCPDLAR